jgi:hypothetical protein
LGRWVVGQVLENGEGFTLWLWGQRKLRELEINVKETLAVIYIYRKRAIPVCRGRSQ